MIGVALLAAVYASTAGLHAGTVQEGSRLGEPYDVVIANARILDGTGNPWYRGDIGIRGKRIATIGDLSSAEAKRRIDAKNRVASPGFIDMHSHASWKLLVDPRAASKITQGVTLEIEGEGSSVAPLTPVLIEKQRRQYERFGITPDWRTIGDYFQRLERTPANVNFATYLGTSTVREIVIGHEDRPATPDELDRMRQMVREAMEDGALGIYSALMYSPDRFNRTEELIEMAKVASQYGGVYQTHPRSESDAFRESLAEIFRIAREAEIPGHITHFKVTYTQNWGDMPEAIRLIEQARQEGLSITADQYPYVRAGGSFTALLPPWVKDGGRPKIVERLRDPDTRDRIKRELSASASKWENEYYGAGDGPAGFSITSARGRLELKPYEGRTLADIAAAEGKDPRDVVLDIVLAGDAGMTVLITDEDDLRLAMKQPWVAFGSDGATVAPDGPLSEGGVHPRGYGSYTKILGTYVRELDLLTLEDAIRKATSLPAQILGIKDRGLLREGFYADIVVFDPATIIDKATYDKPHQFSEGIAYVFVNGEAVLDEGTITDARSGMIVRGPGYRQLSR